MENNAIILQSQVLSAEKNNSNHKISNSQVNEIVQLNDMNNEVQNSSPTRYDWTPKAPMLKEKTISEIQKLDATYS